MLLLNNIEYLVEKEISNLCGLSVHWFRKARQTGETPPYYKLNGKVYYQKQQVDKWFEEHLKLKQKNWA